MKPNDVMGKKNLKTLPSSPRQTDSPRDQCPLVSCWLHAQQGRAWSSLVLFKFGLIGSPTGWEDNSACTASHIFIAPLSLEQRLWLGGCGHLSSWMPWDYLSMSWVPLITQERATDPLTAALSCLQSCGLEEMPMSDSFQWNPNETSKGKDQASTSKPFSFGI